MKYNFVYVVLVFTLICSGKEQPDSTHIDHTREEIISDSSFRDEVLNKINSLTNNVGMIKKITEEIRELNNQSNSFFYGWPAAVLASLFASIITLLGHYFFTELRLKNKFKYLEGNYKHFVYNEVKPNCFTEIKYSKGGKLLLDTKTNYGNWQARIVLDKDIPENGGGVFNYEDKDEGGFMNISVRDKDSIYVFPFTLTHKEQKVNFYVLKRINN